MRITGGQHCNREILVPKTDLIRPTQDRVRQAVFNIIQTEVAGCDFLDLFAGSGAVGLEALSRGAASATFVEQSRKHLEVLRKNLAVLCKPGIPTSQHPNNQVICSDVYRWLATYVGPGFSVGFADPPYRLGEEKGYAQVLATLAERNVIRTGGLFIAEMTAVQKAEETPGWDLLRDREYGKTRICIWRRVTGTE